MTTLLSLIARVQLLAADRKGATAIEYGLIAAGISVAIATIVGTVGTGVESAFTDISTHL